MQGNESARYLELSKDRQFPAAVELANRVAIPLNGTIVDVACGPGALCRYLADQHPSCQIIGIDKSAEVLRLARELGQPGGYLLSTESALSVREMKKGPRNRILYIRGDSSALPLRDFAVDVLFSTSSLHWFFPHQQSFVREALRVLRAGSQLAIEWFTKPCPQHVNHVDSLVFTALATLGLERYATSFEPFGPRFLTAEQVDSLLRDGGFMKIQIDANEIDVSYASGKEAVEHWHTSFAQELCGWLPEQYRANFLATIKSLIDTQRDRQADHRYHMNGIRLFAIARKDENIRG